MLACAYLASGPDEDVGPDDAKGGSKEEDPRQFESERSPAAWARLASRTAHLSVHRKGKWQGSGFRWAVQSGIVAVVKQQLQAAPSKDALPLDLLHVAAQCGHTDILQASVCSAGTRKIRPSCIVCIASSMHGMCTDPHQPTTVP